MRVSFRFPVLLLLAFSSLFVRAEVAWSQSRPVRRTAPLLKVGDLAPPVTVGSWWKDRAPRFESGTIYLIDFWASWCGPCRQSFPHLAELQQRYAGQKFVTVAISIDESPASAEQFLKTQGSQFETYIALDAQQKSYTNWVIAAGKNAIPCSFLVGRDGRIAWIGHPAVVDDPLKSLAQAQKVTATAAPTKNTTQGAN